MCACNTHIDICVLYMYKMYMCVYIKCVYIYIPLKGVYKIRHKCNSYSTEHDIIKQQFLKPLAKKIFSTFINIFNWLFMISWKLPKQLKMS